MLKALILLVVLALGLAGGVLYFAGKAEDKAPAVQTLRVEAQNVGPY